MPGYFAGFFTPIMDTMAPLTTKYKYSILFLLIPVIYLLNATTVHYMMGAFFMGSVDPEYFYLYNGTIIGSGTLSVQYIAHPGTPLQFLIAFSNKAVSFFQPGGYMQGIVDDPEKYIHTANLFLNILTALVLFIMGIMTRRYTGSVAGALLFQLTALSSASLLHIAGRLIPEALMVIPMFLVGILMLKYIFDEDAPGKQKQYIIMFALITAFGTACKLSFLPVGLLPFILMKLKAKQLMQYMLYGVLFFAVFAYPVVFNMVHFWQWVSGIFSHTGKYGGGQEGLVDLASVPGNLKLLFGNDLPFFAISFISTFIAFVSYAIPRLEDSIPAQRIRRAILAVNVTIITAVAFTLKHFEVYYFFPYYSFKYLLVLLTVLLVVRLPWVARLKSYRVLAWALAMIVALIIVYSQAMKMQGIQAEFQEKKENREVEYYKVQSLIDPGSPLIISGRYYGAPYVEFAHYNGFQMCMNRKGYFTSYLREKFPRSYLYVDWSDKFYFWNDLVDAGHVVDRSNGIIYVYTGETKEGDLAVIEGRLRALADMESLNKEMVYRNDATGEQLVKITLH